MDLKIDNNKLTHSIRNIPVPNKIIGISNNKDDSNQLNVSNIANTFKDILKTSEDKTKEGINNQAALYDVVSTISKAETQIKLLITMRDAVIGAWNELTKMNI